MTAAERLDRYLGTLVGAAVGDALGEPVEFMSRAAIEAEFGPEGITDYASPVGLVTDDTQMTLATAAAALRLLECNPINWTITQLIGLCWSAYREWHDAQWGGAPHPAFPLMAEAVRRQGARAPGGTCCGALAEDLPGSPLEPLNNSKGAGGIMRAAPLGLLGRGPDPFLAGCLAAALTHGHLLGYYPAGALAVLVHQLVAGVCRDLALAATIERLRPAAIVHPDVQNLIALVLEAADRAAADGLAWSPEEVGRGWVGDEALAIAVGALMGCQGDVAAGLRWAVNHGGDSDTTGCVAGALLGATWGEGAIPISWRARLEDVDVIRQLATRLAEAAEAHGAGQGAP
jgi:ADP-ribosylglycohydrolase